MRKVGKGIRENQETLEEKEGENVLNQHAMLRPPKRVQALIWNQTHYYPFPLKRVWIFERAPVQEHRTLGGSHKPKQITPYVKKKKGIKSQTALGEHTHAIPETSSLENVFLSLTSIDAS